MGEPPPTVLVLGAGFTRAFVPDAPLLFGDFGAKELSRKFQKFPHATRVLDAETGGRSGQEINIERLMTRLDGLMPYDRRHGAERELALLLTKLKANFVKSITDARGKEFQDNDLVQFARCCVTNGINCITFNYDDVLDEALWKVNPIHGDFRGPHWQPVWGYGFYCRSSYDLVDDAQLGSVLTSMRLIKLHGSVNWRTKLGSPQPYGLDAVVNHESWFSPFSMDRSLVPHIEDHLDPEPFIVPPVLVKSSLVEEPVLQFMWSLAYEVLEKAERVIFVGYSFPVTDMATRFLFTETLLRDKERPDIRVVNLKSAEDEREAVRRNYREVFPEIAESQFDFQGARNWSREFVDTFADEEQVSN